MALSPTLEKILSPVNSKFGAPMGRSSYDRRPTIGMLGDGTKLVDGRATIFDCFVPMSSCGAYDVGGAYWGIGPRLRVAYTKDLNFVQFYREGENPFS